MNIQMTTEFLDTHYRLITKGDWPNLRPFRFQPFGIVPKMLVLPKEYSILTNTPSTYRYRSVKYLKRLIQKENDNRKG